MGRRRRKTHHPVKFCGPLKEERQMTAAQLATLATGRAGEDECVREWRLEELLRAGYDLVDATEVAFHLEIDLHQATDLVRRGCPSATAVMIMA
jgi:hypothetical protein